MAPHSNRRSGSTLPYPPPAHPKANDNHPRPHNKRPAATDLDSESPPTSSPESEPDHSTHPDAGAGDDDDNDTMEAGAPTARRRKRNRTRHRIITKCDRCRTRKQKCNSVKPCDTCRAYDAVCTYTAGNPLGTHHEPIEATTSELEEVHSGLRRLEALLHEHWVYNRAVLAFPAPTFPTFNPPRGFIYAPHYEGVPAPYSAGVARLTAKGSGTGSRETASSTNKKPVDLEVDNLAAHISLMWMKPPAACMLRGGDRGADSKNKLGDGNAAGHLLLNQIRHALDGATGEGSSASAAPNLCGPNPHAEKDLKIDAVFLESLPTEAQVLEGVVVYFDECNWFFELYDERIVKEWARDLTRAVSLYASGLRSRSHLFATGSRRRQSGGGPLAPPDEAATSVSEIPLSQEQWIRFAQILAICRVAVAFESRARSSLPQSKGGAPFVASFGEVKEMRDLMEHLADLAVEALRRGGCSATTSNPTVAGVKAAVTLLSAVFFDTGYGFAGGTTRKIAQLRTATVDFAFRLHLNRDPSHIVGGSKIDALTADERRRVWWTLISADAHIASVTGAPHTIIPLEQANTMIPRSPPYSLFPCAAPLPVINPTTNDLDLRSSEVRFLFAEFNNRIARLLHARNPSPTEDDIRELDDEIIGWEQRVRGDHKLLTRQDTIFQVSLARESAVGAGKSKEFERGQTIFYISLFHLRSKLHRPLHTPDKANSEACDVAWHRDVVIKCSLLMIGLYQLDLLSTAYTMAIIHAALSLLLDVWTNPQGPEASHILAQVSPFLDQLQQTAQDSGSVVLQRASRGLNTMKLAALNGPVPRFQAVDALAEPEQAGSALSASDEERSPPEDGQANVAGPSASSTATAPDPPPTFADYGPFFESSLGASAEPFGTFTSLPTPPTLLASGTLQPTYEQQQQQRQQPQQQPPASQPQPAFDFFPQSYLFPPYPQLYLADLPALPAGINPDWVAGVSPWAVPGSAPPAGPAPEAPAGGFLGNGDWPTWDDGAVQPDDGAYEYLRA